MFGAPVDAGGVNLDQDLVVCDGQLLDRLELELEHVRRAESVLDDRLNWRGLLLC